MSIFDGLAGALNDTFGAPVLLSPEASPDITVTAVFRTGPVEVFGEDGRPILIEMPTLQIPDDLADPVVKGMVVMPSAAPGRSFRVLSRHRKRSPAADAFVICALEEI